MSGRPMQTAGGGVLERGRPVTREQLERRADFIRVQTLELTEIAGSGHYTSVFSCAEILAVLYDHALRLDPGRPDWPDRDRFLLGKGHAAIGVYPVLADLGYFPVDWLARYGQVGNPLGDHPDMRTVPGFDFSSGSLGKNLSVGVGMALAGRLGGRDYRTVVLLGDGELNEGQVWEAAQAAAHHRLGNLVAIVDANGLSLDGRVQEVMGVEPIAGKFEAFGWRAVELDGHDVDALVAATGDLPDPATAECPTVLVARTRKGAGVPWMEGDAAWHLGNLTPGDKQKAIQAVAEHRRR